jgi:hypothetical protein
MTRSMLAKAFGLRRGPLSDTTWELLPTPMLKLLVAIEDAEKRIGAQPPTHKVRADQAARTSCSDPKSSAKP